MITIIAGESPAPVAVAQLETLGCVVKAMTFHQKQGLMCLLPGVALLVWVLREDHNAKSGQATRKWSRGSLFNILYGALALIFMGILMLIIGD